MRVVLCCAQTVRSVAIEGDTVATGLQSGGIALFEGSSGRQRATLEGHAQVVIGLAMRDGHVYSGGGDKSVKQWLAASGACVATMAEHTDTIFSVAAGDQVVLSASRDTTVKLWPAGGGPSRHTMKHPERAYGVSVQGDAVATACGDGVVRVWSLVTGECAHALRGHTQAVVSVSLQGRLLASGAYDWKVPGSARVWWLGDDAAWTCIAALDHTTYVRAALLRPNGELWTHANQLKVWGWSAEE